MKNKIYTVLFKDNTSQDQRINYEIDNDQIIYKIDFSYVTLFDLKYELLEKLSTFNNLLFDVESCVKSSSKYHDIPSIINLLVTVKSFLDNKHVVSFKTTDNNNKKTRTYKFINESEWSNLIEESQTLLNAQIIARVWQELPSNYLNPKKFVEDIKDIFKDLKDKVNIKILNYGEILSKKMGLLSALGQSSKYGSYVVSMEYKTSNDIKKRALIGKGICFDTGGYNIKTGSYMKNMKYDMSGAASVVAAIYALASNKIEANVIGIVGIAENVISDVAYKPDDVLISYSKKSVEIDNTDAEGRLLLADCITYAIKDYKADEILTIATLTGAIIYALGDQYAGCWSTTDNLFDKINFSAKYSSDSIWRMPFNKKYLDLLTKSKIADIKNSSGVPGGSSSQAAEFLKYFTNGLPYIHLDVAGIDNHKTWGGTAPLVKTLYYFIKFN